MTARWPASETLANYSASKDEWSVTAITELPCKHLVSTKRKDRDKAKATAAAKAALPGKVRSHGHHWKRK